MPQGTIMPTSHHTIPGQFTKLLGVSPRKDEPSWKRGCCAGGYFVYVRGLTPTSRTCGFSASLCIRRVTSPFATSQTCPQLFFHPSQIELARGRVSREPCGFSYCDNFNTGCCLHYASSKVNLFPLTRMKTHRSVFILPFPSCG